MTAADAPDTKPPPRTGTKFVCHEDGTEWADLEGLRRHLRAKTAWSNAGLVGCRVSVLLENREWSEGLVAQYHRSSGKHCVEFRHSGARRWLLMLRTAFYIVDRGTCDEETKEPEGLPVLRNTRDEPWTFAEDLSLAFAKAQSVLHDCYGGRTQETGHKTLGHVCVTDDDRRRATEDRGSLLYGELLPRGVHKALDARHLDAARASSVYDLGCGTGKVALQAFLQFPNLKRVYGVELSLARFHVAERALLALAARDDCDAHVTRREPGSSIEVTSNDRTLIIEHGNLMRTRDVGDASGTAWESTGVCRVDGVEVEP